MIMKKIKIILSDKKILTNVINFMISLVLVIICIFGVATFAHAWFSQNDHVSAGGMSVSTTVSYMRFGDTITAKAVMGTTSIAEGTYKRKDEKDTNYYLYKDGAYDETAGVKYTSLFPGEYIELNFKITCAPNNEKEGYNLSFVGLSNSSTFEVVDDNQVKQIYTILGVYRLAVVKSDAYGNETEIDKGFLVDYDKQKTIDDNYCFDFCSADNWDEKGVDGYIDIKIRLYVDLTQYNKIPNTIPNLLSSKTMDIGGIRLEPKKVNA